jgi:Cd2+/Zn2+-exporting ATPase
LTFVLSFLSIPEGLITALYALSILTGGIYVVKGAMRGLLKQRFLNIDFLVVIASLGAIYINQLPEAAAVIFFFSLSEALEEYGIARSRKALQALLHSAPQTTTLLDGKVIAVTEVTIGSQVAVRPGELIPLDGKVIKGNSAVNEATITGEPLPRNKEVGDLVFAGTLNENGYLEIEVTKESKDSTFSKIVRLVEQAQLAKAPSQEFIDRFAKYYTPTVVILALAITIVPPIVLNEPFIVWFTRALVLLVIACPCALVISTPVAITSAIGGASRKGVLIKGGKYLEEMKKVKAVAFDKTGTLTVGEPYISDVIAFARFTEKEIIEDAAGVEEFSSHPLSKSILEYAKEKGILSHTMTNYENVAGKGGKAVCTMCNDLEHCVGNLKLMDTHGISTEEITAKTEQLEREGKTIVLVSSGNKLMGVIAISDRVREEAMETISVLKTLGVQAVMLTGDNQHTASYVAEGLGIDRAYGSLLPEDKVTKIEELRKEYTAVAMIGDGVNDAPSLALANVGIAMASKGSDVAIETADIALMNESLLNIPDVVKLSKRTVRTIKQNVTGALLAKGVFMALAVFGVSNLSIAIAADTGMALLVILNSLRLFRFQSYV